MKKQLEQLSAYEPGLSPEALKTNTAQRELFKLASNENLYGPTPKVKEAIEQHLDELYYYPESGSPGLRKVLSEHLNVDESRIFWSRFR